MQLVRVIVEGFMAIERCEVELGAGLNILHGPNDLGKSTLAKAIRAALLLPYSSTLAEEFKPWHGDHVPSVSLTFLDASKRWNRVKKEFADKGRGRASLEWSNDGKSWSSEATGKEVDEKLRALLGWGIPAPAGKGGPKGLPESFIKKALLADQTDVDEILETSLETDPDDSGRVKLTKALQGLAQDPEFKRVLDSAMKETDRYFTATGKKKSGEGSPFKQAAERVAKLTAELETVNEAVLRSTETEQRIADLQAACVELEGRRQDAEAAIQDAKDRLAKTIARARAQDEVDRARVALKEIDDRHADVARRTNALAAMDRELEKLDKDLAAAKAELDRAEAELRRCEEAHRALTSDQAANERKLRRSELEKEGLSVDAKIKAEKERQSKAESARALLTRAAELEKKRADLERKISAEEDAKKKAETKLSENDALRQQLEDTALYARWHRAERSFAEAKTAREESEKLEAEARSLLDTATGEIEALRSKRLPNEATADALETLEQELKLAEAALGGGLSLVFTARRKLALETKVDSEKKKKRTVDGEIRLEADRSISIAIEDLADLEIVAGDAEKRSSAEALRKRWSAEATPILTASGVSTAAELGALVRQTRELERTARSRLDDVKRLQERAKEIALRGQDLAAKEIELADWTSRVAGRDLSRAKALHATLKSGWEAQTEDTKRALEAEREKIRASQSRSDQEIARLGGERTSLEPLIAASRSEAAEIESALGTSSREVLDRLERTLLDLHKEKTRIDRAIESIEKEGSGAEKKAAEALEKAKADLATRKTSLGAKEAAARSKRSERDQAGGALVALRQEAEKLSRDGAQTRLGAAEKYLAELPVPKPPATEDDVRAAERATKQTEADLQQKRQELATAQGELTAGQGTVARDRLADIESALSRAKETHAELEIDAAAWRLLRDTLREAENSGAQHLGRALATDVTRNFAELTNSRYAAVQIGPALKTEGVTALNQSRGLEVLSAGTRDQLATLLRLAIAESLKSAIVLDDQLVQSDPERLAWFRRALARTAEKTQVVVLTCRKQDYEGFEPEVTKAVDLRHCDLSGHLRRFDGLPRRASFDAKIVRENGL
jgi:DNA repair exonuclease SbcCD ATPase subunit